MSSDLLKIISNGCIGTLVEKKILKKTYSY